MRALHRRPTDGDEPHVHRIDPHLGRTSRALDTSQTRPQFHTTSDNTQRGGWLSPHQESATDLWTLPTDVGT
jgi:hypothetical protein